MEQLTLFEKRCDCGREPEVVQYTIFGETPYCLECYNELTEKTQEVEHK